MVKIVCFLSAVSGLLLTLGLSAANDCRIVTSDGREIKTSAVDPRPNGDLEYVSEDGKLKTRIAKGRYRYAWIPKPAMVTEADTKFKEGQWKTSAELYRKAGEEYKPLGWDLYCMRMEAESLIRQGEKKEAARKLETVRSTRLQNPALLTDLLYATDLLAELLIEQKRYAEATVLLDKLLKSDNPDLVFAAFFKKALILQDQGKFREAALTFYQTALLFPKSPRRPEALYKCWGLLSDLKDPSADKIADLLKKEYPEDALTRQLLR